MLHFEEGCVLIELNGLWGGGGCNRSHRVTATLPSPPHFGRGISWGGGDRENYRKGVGKGGIDGKDIAFVGWLVGWLGF